MFSLFLARKTSKQVFVSYNLSNTDSNFTLLVENRIKEEMETFPEKFWAAEGRVCNVYINDIEINRLFFVLMLHFTLF